MLTSLIIFILMYIAMIAFPKYKLGATLSTVAIYLVIGTLSIADIWKSIDWNILFMLSGIMIIVYYFIDSKMPSFIADKILSKSTSLTMVIISISLVSGVISAFVDNLATVLMLAPVGLTICEKLKISPVGMLLSISISSNLQGAATLVGDTTSILLGSYADMSFTDFFFFQGKPSIFFAVELGMIATIPVMYFLFRDSHKIINTSYTKITTIIPTFILVGTILTLIGISFIDRKPEISNGLVCMFFALLSIVTGKKELAKDAIKNLDYETLLLLTSLFCVITGINNAGVITEFSNLIVKFGGNNIFLLYTIIVLGSVVISGFIDNIPYVATMLPVISTVSASLGISPYVLYFGLLSGATLGGNITPIGASSNIATVGILRKEGYDVTFTGFMKVGVPFTLAAVGASYVFIWFMFR